MAWWEWALGVQKQPAAAVQPALRRGRIGSLGWEARVTARPVSYGLNPGTLLKGQGRVARLVVYETIGRAEVPRKLAVYDRGWHFGRKAHLDLIRRVMAELGRQDSV